MRVIKADLEGIKKGAEIILNGGLVVYPTETVYGLGCLPSDPDAAGEFVRLSNEQQSLCL
jgi:L-threonylcarbamoyladenylate synthase